MVVSGSSPGRGGGVGGGIEVVWGWGLGAGRWGGVFFFCSWTGVRVSLKSGFQLNP